MTDHILECWSMALQWVSDTHTQKSIGEAIHVCASLQFRHDAAAAALGGQLLGQGLPQILCHLSFEFFEFKLKLEFGEEVVGVDIINVASELVGELWAHSNLGGSGLALLAHGTGFCSTLYTK
jgi:hypothetical protein